MIFRPITDHINRGIQLTACQQAGSVSPVDLRAPERYQKKRRRNDRIMPDTKQPKVEVKEITPKQKMKRRKRPWTPNKRDITKSWKNRKGDWLQEYRGSKAFNHSCRNHGSCDYCRDNRTYKDRRERERTAQALREWRENIGPEQIIIDPWESQREYNSEMLNRAKIEIGEYFLEIEKRYDFEENFIDWDMVGLHRDIWRYEYYYK